MAPLLPVSNHGRTAFGSLVVVAILTTLCLVPAVAEAQPQSLTFFKNYFHTGGHFAAGVGIKGSGVNGLATKQITIAGDPTGAAGVPPSAEILAAFLYWQTVTTTAGNGAAGAVFNGNDISQIAKNLNPAGNPPCWSSGGATGGGSGAHQVKTYRADVLPFLRVQNGKRTAIDTHTVVLPDSGSGNQVPSTTGASLVFIYRVAGQPQLTSTVIYDGGFTLNQTNPVLTQPLLGWYQAAGTGGAATLTQIVGNAQQNFTEAVTFKDGSGTTLFTRMNPFVGPSWDTNRESFTLTGSTGAATVTVERGSSSGSFDCLSWGAMILSTTVEDTDKDGIVDRLETLSDSGKITDPNTGEKLPDLYAMGARTGIKDIFIEFGMMKSSTGFSNALQTVAPGHTHQPAREALDMVIKAFRFAPERINVHFDLGGAIPNAMKAADWEACPTATTKWTTDCAIIPVKHPATDAPLAEGGEFIEETPCDLSKVASCLFADYPAPLPCTGPGGVAAACRFPDFPGTVGWKSGFRAYRDEPLNFRKTKLSGQATVDAGPDERACFVAETDVKADGTPNLATTCKRRFARNRSDLFHYVLWAHTIGLSKSDNPQVPQYYQPKNMSGIADVNGSDLMITLGLWDFATGTAFMQASTFMHELGHNLGRRHGGDEGQPNCKPNYQSVMNYLFQVRGLITAGGLAEIGYSNQKLNTLVEGDLNETLALTNTVDGKPMQWRTRWYTNWQDSFIDKNLNITEVTKRCNGSPRDGESMARVDGQTIGPNDWNGNGSLQADIPGQDLNFSGSEETLAAGSNDWSALSLRELGGRRNVGGWSADSGYWDTGYWDTGTDAGYWDTGYWDTGYWDTGYWDTGFWDSGYWDTGAENDPETPIGELELDTAGAVGNAPGFVTAKLSGRDVLVEWSPPNVGAENVQFYEVYRLEGATITATNLAAKVPVGIGPINAPTVSVLDTTTKNNVTYIYIVLAQFKDPDGAGPELPVRSGIAMTAPFSR